MCAYACVCVCFFFSSPLSPTLSPHNSSVKHLRLVLRLTQLLECVGSLSVWQVMVTGFRKLDC